jgi:uncharacterized protein YaaR (DUF327 family)
MRAYGAARYNRPVSRIDPLGKGVRGAAGARRAVARAQARAEAERGAGGIPTSIAPLIAEVDQSGSELSRDPTGPTLERYRRAVQRLLDAAVDGSLRVTSEASRGLSQKVFSTITRINLALAELAEAVLGRQQDVLKARELIDQVKGLIVDLYR